MPPHLRRVPAALLLTWAVLGGGCLSAGPDDGIRFACESDGSCSQPDHVCALDGLCHPRGARLGTVEPGLVAAPGQGARPTSPPVAVQGPRSHPGTASASRPASPEDRCPQQCARRQSDCTAHCEEGPNCLQHCRRFADDCYAGCLGAVDAREAAQQRNEQRKHCMDANGRMRTCSAGEEQQWLAAARQASKLVCQDARGEQVLCPENREQLERSRRFIPKDCPSTGCEGDGAE